MTQTLEGVNLDIPVKSAVQALNRYILQHDGDYSADATWEEREMDAVRNVLRRISYHDGMEGVLDDFVEKYGTPALLRILALAIEEQRRPR